MSRIEEALRRNREAAGEKVAVPSEVDADIINRFPRSREYTAAESEPQELAATVAIRPRRPGATGVGVAEPSLADVVSPAVREKLVVGSDSTPLSAEQYRRLAATLHHAQADRNLKVVMTASALASEGKTLTATNLALTLSESYKRRVLLIDADLRRPAIHQIFQLPNTVGLTDGLKNESEDTGLNAVQVTPRLAVVTAGRPDPDPLGGLSSERMRLFVREAAESFDWVIIDSPPVLLMPDAGLVASMVDAVVFVIAAGSTPHNSIQRAVEMIGRGRIIGVVLNKVDKGVMHAGGQYETYYAQYASPRKTT